MSDVPLGKIITGEAHRDAIHIAIAPVTAAVMLYPAQEVRLLTDGQRVDGGTPSVGIVDPFLRGPVFEGQRFYVFLHPQTVTGMRHHWQHPAFDGGCAASAPLPPHPDIAASEKWLKDFCADSDGPSYDVIRRVLAGEMDGFGDVSFRVEGEYFYVYGQNASGEIPPEFWEHVEVVTGKMQINRPSHFTCSC
jgi:hypothetical protein